jgi:protein required for attachment to host cells
MVWTVIANSNSCRIFDYDKRVKQLTLVKELFHPQSKLKGSDLVSDAPGHYKTRGPTHGSYEPREEPKENEVDHFAREIAKLLDAERRQNHYEELILIAPPHMNGLIHSHLNSHVLDIIVNDINKDMANFTEHQILEALQREIKH